MEKQIGIILVDLSVFQQMDLLSLLVHMETMAMDQIVVMYVFLKMIMEPGSK